MSLSIARLALLLGVASVASSIPVSDDCSTNNGNRDPASLSGLNRVFPNFLPMHRPGRLWLKTSDLKCHNDPQQCSGCDQSGDCPPECEGAIFPGPATLVLTSPEKTLKLSSTLLSCSVSSMVELDTPSLSDADSADVIFAASVIVPCAASPCGCLVSSSDETKPLDAVPALDDESDVPMQGVMPRGNLKDKVQGVVSRLEELKSRIDSMSPTDLRFFEPKGVTGGIKFKLDAKEEDWDPSTFCREVEAECDMQVDTHLEIAEVKSCGEDCLEVDTYIASESDGSGQEAYANLMALVRDGQLDVSAPISAVQGDSGENEWQAVQQKLQPSTPEDDMDEVDEGGDSVGTSPLVIYTSAAIFVGALAVAVVAVVKNSRRSHACFICITGVVETSRRTSKQPCKSCVESLRHGNTWLMCGVCRSRTADNGRKAICPHRKALLEDKSLLPAGFDPTTMSGCLASEDDPLVPVFYCLSGHHYAHVKHKAPSLNRRRGLKCVPCSKPKTSSSDVSLESSPSTLDNTTNSASGSSPSSGIELSTIPETVRDVGVVAKREVMSDVSPAASSPMTLASGTPRDASPLPMVEDTHLFPLAEVQTEGIPFDDECFGGVSSAVFDEFQNDLYSGWSFDDLNSRFDIRGDSLTPV